tara:strand:- start:9456 stop:9872 length:417 start_codon:yes stop_codon:yes gene_type:complete
MSKDHFINRSEEEWRSTMTEEQYYVCREQGTERPFSGKYWDTKDQGTYVCSACQEPLFTSDTKFDSGTGWPSFFEPLAPESLERQVDEKFGMKRVEVHCSRCKSHLGHVFEDGPNPTGLRYCINSISLQLKKTKTIEK